MMKRTALIMAWVALGCGLAACPPDVEPASSAPGQEPEAAEGTEEANASAAESGAQEAQSADTPADPEATTADDPAPEPEAATAIEAQANAPSGRETGPPPGSGPDVQGTTLNDDCPFQLSRLQVAATIEEREPVAFDGHIPADDTQVWIYMDFDNEDGEENVALIRWDHAGDAPSHEQTMGVGQSPRWRTWVFHRLRTVGAGQWTVTVSDTNGCEVGSIVFTAVNP